MSDAPIDSSSTTATAGEDRPRCAWTHAPCDRPAADRRSKHGPAPIYCGLPGEPRGPSGEPTVHDAKNQWRLLQGQEPVSDDAGNDDRPVTTAARSAEGTLDRAQQLYAQLLDQLQLLNTQLATVNDPAAAEAQIAAAISTAEQEASAARAEAAREKARALDLQSARDQAVNAANEMAAQTEAAEAARSELEAEATALREQNNELTAELAEAISRSRQLEADLAAKTSAYAELEVALDAANTTIIGLNEQLDATRAEVSDANARADQSERELTALRTEHEATVTDRNRLSSAYERAQADVTDLRERLGEAERRAEREAGFVVTERARADQAEQRAGTYADQLDEERARLEELRERMRQLEQNLAGERIKTATLTTERDSAQSLAQRMEQDRDRERAEATALRRDLVEQRSLADTFRAKYEQLVADRGETGEQAEPGEGSGRPATKPAGRRGRKSPGDSAT